MAAEDDALNQREKEVKHSGSWTVGILVVVLGLIFLLRNLGVDLFFLQIDNWWALLILFAAFFPFVNAIRRWSDVGFDEDVASGILTAIVIATVACLFLLHLEFSTWWPLFVMYGGAFILINNRR